MDALPVGVSQPRAGGGAPRWPARLKRAPRVRRRVSLRVAPDAEGIRLAAEALRRGDLVVFPTETVYGLGAHALDPAAIARVFQAKGRPADNPLIVHVPDAAAARRLARTWPAEADALARAFWPGPLTLVLPRAPHVPDVTTGGLDSVAVRVPDHAVARALLEAAGVPVAAPSANRSGRPSPTRAQDAEADLGAAVAVYVDGGPTRVGLESTVVSLVGPRPVLLRLGGVTKEALERIVGPMEEARKGDLARSPGTRYRHYAPKARVHLVHGGRRELEAALARLAADGSRVALVAAREDAPTGLHVRVPGGLREPEAWARALFALLRDLDEDGYRHVVVQAIPEDGIGAAVMDRLRRAAEG